MFFELQGKTVTVFGGTGFIGRYVVERLARAGATVRVVTRHRQSAYFLRTSGTVGQIVPVAARCDDFQSVECNISGSDMVVNCIGVLNQTRHGSFQHMHVDIPQWIAEACALRNVKRFVHISAMGADKAQSHYAQSKLAGEKAVLAAFPSATILRPSVVFGPEDKFFNMFAKLSRIVPAMPLIGGGRTKFQPVYVGDVAAAVIAALTLPVINTVTGQAQIQGKIYQLGGPEILSMRDIYDRLAEYTGRRKPYVPISWGLARLQASFMHVLPNPPLTNDQITSLQTDCIVASDSLRLTDLGLEATSLDAILPSYLASYRPGGRFAEKKRA